MSKVEPNRSRRAKTGGRKKGTPNRLTGDIKAMILAALENKGGIEYLEKQAEDNPTAFMTLVGKVLPLQLHGPGDKGEHLHELTVRFVRPGC